MLRYVIERLLEHLIILSSLVEVSKAELHSVYEARQVISLISRYDHLQEGYKVLFKLAFEYAQTLLHDLDGEFDNLIEVHKFLNDVRDEDPDLLEELLIGVVTLSSP